MSSLRVIASAFSLFATSCCHLLSQSFAWPLDSTLPLTGNYGELRPNHFHTGIDFSTNNKVNVPVFAIENGFVSRIRISPVGYGKSIYITHPGGRVSVYAHLNCFAEPFQSAFMAELKSQQVYEKDWYLSPNQWPVKKGQEIGKSGNTGGSTGPHVHFEIRDEQTEIPFNPMLFYKFNDQSAPRCKGIAFVDLSDSLSPKPIRSFKVPVLTTDSGLVRMPDYVSPTALVGLAFSGADQVISGGNANQVNAARLFVDDDLVYSHQFAALSFDNGRYVNEFYFKLGNEKYQKCFLPEYFPSGIYVANAQRGRVYLNDTLWHNWSLILTDEAGNTTTVGGRLRTKAVLKLQTPPCNDVFVPVGTRSTFAAQDLQIDIPSNVLYSSSCLRVLGSVEKDKAFKILPEDLNLNSAVQLSMRVPKRFENKKNKLLLKNGSNALVPVVRNDSLVFFSKSTGAFTWQIDTIAPTLKMLLPKGRLNTQAKELRFLMRDQLSGISDFVLMVNDQWTFAYYDAKDDVLILQLNDNSLKGNLKFQLRATDKCGNTSTLTTHLKRP